MAIRLRKTVFLHIPKTGGTWVSAVLRKLCIVHEETTRRPHMRWPEILADPKMSAWRGLKPFAFVRNPVSWYRSYWAYKNRMGWEKGNWIDEACSADTFAMFVLKCITKHPGLLGQMYERHTNGVETVGRFETLREDLLRILKAERVGELPDIPPINASPSLPECPPDLARAIEEAEADTMKRWGYTTMRSES